MLERALDIYTLSFKRFGIPEKYADELFTVRNSLDFCALPQRLGYLNSWLNFLKGVPSLAGDIFAFLYSYNCEFLANLVGTTNSFEKLSLSNEFHKLKFEPTYISNLQIDPYRQSWSLCNTAEERFQQAYVCEETLTLNNSLILKFFGKPALYLEKPITTSNSFLLPNTFTTISSEWRHKMHEYARTTGIKYSTFCEIMEWSKITCQPKIVLMRMAQGINLDNLNQIPKDKQLCSPVNFEEMED